MGQRPDLSFVSAGVTVTEAGRALLSGGTAVVNYRARGKTCRMRITGPDAVSDTEGLVALWHWVPQGDGFDVWLEVANRGVIDLLLDTLDVLAIHPDSGAMLNIGTPPARWAFYHHGWESSSPTFARHTVDSYYTEPGTSEYHRLHYPHWDALHPNDLVSEWVTVIAPGEPSLGVRSVLLGFVTVKDQLSEIRLGIDDCGSASLVVRCHLDDVALHPGQSICSERLWMRTGCEPLRLLEEWARRVGEISDARLQSPPPTGWCPRYYFRGADSATDLEANIRAMKDYSLPLDVVLIDDGYQTAVGDWFSMSDKFPDGIEALTADIRASGCRPGISLSPFGVEENSQLLAKHPDWVLRDSAGEPVLGWRRGNNECYALDCTHPEVLIWLERIFRQMRERWGIAYFEVEHVSAAALRGCHYDPDITRAQAVRLGMKAIRDAVGEDAFLLACAAPIGPCVGLVDGMRVGPNVDPNWYPIWSHDLSLPSVGNALRNSLARAFMHGRLWLCDPDRVLIRPRGHESELVLNEMRTQISLTALCGGVTIDSDDIAAVRPGRLKYLRQILPPTGIAARPVDLFQNETPCMFVLPVNRKWGCWWIAGVVNWDDRTVETTVNLADLGLPQGEYHVYHYWRRRYLGITEDVVTVVRHQPHETAVLMLRPVSDRPDWLTTTFHVCQGLVEVCDYDWDESAGALRIGLRKRGKQFGRVLFTVPDGWHVVEAQIDGMRRSTVEVAQGVLSLGLTLKEHADVTLRFELGG